MRREEIALENAQRAYQLAEVQGRSNPDAVAEKAYQATLSAPDSILDMVQKWRVLTYNIRDWKAQFMPKGTKVQVSCSRYVGPGTVTNHDANCPTDQLPVLLENGNVWWYPLDCCKAV